MTYALRLFGVLSLLSAIKMSEIADLDKGWKLSALVAAIVICGLVSIPRGKLLSAVRGIKWRAKLVRRYPSGGNL
jgi:hypothetical protein